MKYLDLFFYSKFIGNRFCCEMTVTFFGEGIIKEVEIRSSFKKLIYDLAILILFLVLAMFNSYLNDRTFSFLN